MIPQDGEVTYKVERKPNNLKVSNEKSIFWNLFANKKKD